MGEFWEATETLRNLCRVSSGSIGLLVRTEEQDTQCSTAQSVYDGPEQDVGGWR